MMSSYFYPAPSGKGNSGKYSADDWRTPLEGDSRPRQLSLLDWMLQRNEPDAPVTDDSKD
jgi:hypothetical protein